MLLGDRGTCVNNLPKVVTRQCPGAESNLRLWVTSGLQVRLVTVRLPSHTSHLYIRRLELFSNRWKSTILTNFCNPEILGLGHRQFWDSGLVKMAGIPGFGGSRDCNPYIVLFDIAGADVIHWTLLRCKLRGIHLRRYHPLCCHCPGDRVTWSGRCPHSLCLHATQRRLCTYEVWTFSLVLALWASPPWSAPLSWWWGFAPMTWKISEIWRVGAN